MPKNKVKILISMVLVLLLLLSTPVMAVSQVSNKQVSASIKKAVAYLASIQNSDGGFPSTKGRDSSPGITNWVIMALKAAGEDTGSSKWKKSGKSPLDYLERSATSLKDTNDYSRTLLALTASNSGTKFEGIDLTEKIISFQQENGQFAQQDKGEKDLINAHMWAVIALSSAGKDIPNKDKARKWLLDRQNGDGGFGWAVGAESDPDDTGVAITALVLLDENPGESVAIKAALAYLKKQQKDDGGFAWTDCESNAPSDAWVIQGLVAAKEDLYSTNWTKNENTSVSHLVSLQKSDGSFKWMPDVESSPVLMTAYAIMALAEKPFPVNLDFDNLKTSSLKISLSIDKKNSLVNGRETSLDVPPTIINNRTMVPLRFVGESLGAEVEWIGETQTVEIILEGKKLSLVIGKTAPGLDTPATIVNGRTLVPIRYVSENLGAKVTWFAEDRRVEIER